MNMTPTKPSFLRCTISKCRRHAIWVVCLPIFLLFSSSARAERETLSLDGIWEIEDGKSATEMPATFGHTVPVPGLANLATPPLENVDRFFSREQLANRIRSKLSPPEWLKEHWKGKVDQDRDYFWYRKTFRAGGASGRAAQDQQGPVRDGGLAERSETGRVRGLLHRQLLPPGGSHPLERGEHTGRAASALILPCCRTPTPRARISRRSSGRPGSTTAFR